MSLAANDTRKLIASIPTRQGFDSAPGNLTNRPPSCACRWSAVHNWFNCSPQVGTQPVIYSNFQGLWQHGLLYARGIFIGLVPVHPPCAGPAAPTFMSMSVPTQDDESQHAAKHGNKT